MAVDYFQDQQSECEKAEIALNITRLGTVKFLLACQSRQSGALGPAMPYTLLVTPVSPHK